MSIAALSDQAMHYLKYMMLINSYNVMGVAVNTTLIAGIFRAGGDSRFGLICDVIVMWGYAVPMGFFVAFVLKLPVMWVYFLLCTDEGHGYSRTIRVENGLRILQEMSCMGQRRKDNMGLVVRE